MAVTYSENFAAGNSTITGVNVYTQTGFGGSDAVDALYPTVRHTEGATIRTAIGPHGENAFDWNGTYGDYQGVGLGISKFGPLSGLFNAQRGKVSFLQYWSTLAFDTNTNAPLFWLNVNTTDPNSFNAQPFQIEFRLTAGVWRLVVTFWRWSQATLNTSSAPITRSTYENTWVNVEIGWSCGTPSGGAFGFNGSFYVKLNGVVVFTESGHDFYLETDPSIPNYAKSIAFGYAGLMGPLTNIVLDTIDVVFDPPPKGPQTPCDPVSQVGNGGKGASGCNTGGVGWVSQYSGPYGTVPDHADPADGETLTGKEHAGIEVWAELVHTPYPAQSPAQVTYRRAMGELADDSDYEGGRKPEGLLTVGDVENALGNEQGGPEAGTVELQFTDVIDRTFRGLLEDQDLEGDEIRVKLASDAARKAGTPPRVIARAIVQRPRLQSRLRASLSAVDHLFSDFGPFGPNSRFPFWTFGDVGSGMPNAPNDTKAQVIPVLYGEKSDEGATDPVTGEPRAKGLLPSYYCGKFTGITGSTTQQVYRWADPLPLDATLQPPNGFAYNLIGGSIFGFVGGIALAVKDGKASAVGSVGGTGPHTNPDTGRSLTFFWDGAGVGTADYYLVFLVEQTFDPFNVPAATGRVRVKTHDATTIDGDWVNGAHVADFRIDFLSWDDGDDALELVTIPDPDEWGFLAFGLGPWFRYLNLYGSDLGAGDVTAQHERVLLDVLSRSDILVPGINLSDPYVVFTNDDGREFWITGVWVKGPLLDDHLNGVINITANAIGRSEDADGLGLPLFDAHDVEQHWLENDILSQWSSGPYADAVTYPIYEDGTPIVRTSSFRTRQAFEAARLGGRGLTVSWYSDAPVSTTSMVGEWMRQTDSRVGINGHGQIMVWGLDETLDTTTWPRIDEVPDLFGPITRVSGEERANVVSGSGDWDPDKSVFRAGPFTYTSTTGIAIYKNRRKPGELIGFTILNDEAQVRWVLQRTLARRQLGTTLVEVSGSVGFLDYDVGDGVLVTSEDGTGPDGYVDHPFIILRRRFSVSSRLTTYTLWDVQAVLLATAFENGLERLFYATDDITSPTVAPFATDDAAIAPLAVL